MINSSESNGLRGREKFRGRGGRGRGARSDRAPKTIHYSHNENASERADIPESVSTLACVRQIHERSDFLKMMQVKENILMLLREGMLREDSEFLLGSEIVPRYR